MKLIGQERTVTQTDLSRFEHPCEMCGLECAIGRAHEYSDQFVLFGLGIKTYNQGVNRLCRYCSDDPMVETIELPEITYHPSMSDHSVRALAREERDFRRVNFGSHSAAGRETFNSLMEYIRSSTDSPPNGIDTDTISQIEPMNTTIVEPVYQTLHWWVVKALRDAPTELDRSRYYDLLCCVEDATTTDTMGLLKDIVHEEDHDPLRQMVEGEQEAGTDGF